MSEPPTHDEEQLDRQLAELDENPNAPVDSTVRRLYAELETLAETLKQPLPPDPYETESGCLRAVAAVQALAREMPPARADSEDLPTEPIPERLEHFRILKLLGQGGMGAVYLAEDTRLGRQVAIKTLKPERAAKPRAKERFLREARLAAALDHDHICPIYHVGEDSGIPYLAMPLLKGQSLDDRIKGKHKLPPAEVIRLGIQIAAGLAAAHDKGLIHRDIKPSNLWVEAIPGRESSEGRIKILDFGLARSSDTDTGLTQSGTILGTPAYMAPEQARGEKVDARADLYSLGVVLYRLATGELPLKGTDTMSMLLALATQTPRPAREVNPEVPAELSDLIMRLLAKDRDYRPPSARAVIEELQALQHEPATVSLMQPATPGSPWAEVVATAGESSAETQPLPGARGFEKATHARGSGWRPRWPLVAAGFLFAFLGGGLLLQQIILGITDREGKTRDIELKPGDRIEIVEKPAPKPDPAKAPPTKEPDIQLIAGDPDRRAAEYVLSIGGRVQINDKDECADAAALPKEPFRLTAVDLGHNPKVTDAGLAHFKDCKALTYLALGGPGVTDAGLAYFKDCKALTYLALGGPGVTDAGLAYFKDCKGLTHLALSGLGVTDAGLAYFKDCKGLMQLKLSTTQVTDAGLAYFQHCKDLRHIHLFNTPVTDAGLAHFRNCKDLTSLGLCGTRVTDAGLAHFRDCKGLTDLDLRHTEATDAGLAYFQDCKNLRHLALDHTRVTDAGLAYFKECKGLTALLLGVKRVTDAGLANFKDCKKLYSLQLAGTQVTDAGLGYFKDCKGLQLLDLRWTQVTDAGLAHFKGCNSLTDLRLDGTQVTDAGLAYFKDCKRLEPTPPARHAGVGRRTGRSGKLSFLGRTWPRQHPRFASRLRAAEGCHAQMQNHLVRDEPPCRREGADPRRRGGDRPEGSAGSPRQARGGTAQGAVPGPPGVARRRHQAARRPARPAVVAAFPRVRPPGNVGPVRHQRAELRFPGSDRRPGGAVAGQRRPERRVAGPTAEAADAETAGARRQRDSRHRPGGSQRPAAAG
jgi:serine/threonine protein kinase